MNRGFSLARKRNPLLIWWKSIDKALLGVFLLWLAVGMLASSIASPAVADTYGVGPFYFTKKHAIFLFGGLVTSLVLSLFSLSNVQKVTVLTYLGAMVGLLLVLLIGKDVKGASRWIEVVGFTVQPSEFLKVSFPVVAAMILASFKQRKAFVVGCCVTGAMLALHSVFLFLQPDFGMTLVVAMSWVLVLYFSGLPYRVMFLVAGLLPPLCGFAYFTLSHVKTRIDTFLFPESGDVYQISKAEEALLSGGLWGKGIGEGVVKDTVPDAHTDFIFTVLAEELGLVFCTVILLSFGYFVLRAASRVAAKTDDLERVVGLSLLGLFAFQVMVNVGVVLHILPTTGMTLPFMSYGGTSTLALAILVGTVLSITKKESMKVRGRRR